MDTLQNTSKSTSPRNFFKGSPAMAPAFKKSSASWWLNQPMWKICSSNWIISPRFGMKIKIFEVSPPRLFLSSEPVMPLRWKSTYEAREKVSANSHHVFLCIICFVLNIGCFPILFYICFNAIFLFPNTFHIPICSSHSFLHNMFFPICSKYLY